MQQERYRRISDGFAVYLPNKQSKTYWCRLRILKKEIKKTTNEREIDKAIERAYMIKAHLQNRVERDLPVTSSKTINAISKDFLKYVEKTQAPSTQKSIIRYFKRYLMKDWGNRPIDEIKASDILKLYDNHDLDGTKIGKYTEILLKRLFDFLEYNDFISKENRPTIPKPKPKDTESYDLLRVEELKAFEDAFEKRMNEQSELYAKTKTKRDRKLQERYYLANLYFLTLMKVGCRPGVELLDLKFEDVVVTNKKFGGAYFSWDQLNIKINSGKMSKRNGFRIIPAPQEFSVILDAYCREFYGVDYLECIAKYHDRYIFSYGEKKSKITDFDDIYNEVRDELRKRKLLRENIKVAQYSFRHTYITFALVQKVDVYLLAENCGNSVNVIQKTYSKLAASMRSEEIYKINLYASLDTSKPNRSNLETTKFDNVFKSKDDSTE